jgi:uncharacterized protein
MRRANVMWLILLILTLGCSDKERSGPLTFREAVQTGNIQEMQRLIESGVPFDEADERSGWAPIHQAARSGGPAAIRLLAEKGADVNKPTRAGLTPLHIAVRSGQAESVRELLTAGANVHVRDEDGGTPLQYSRSFQQPMIERLLIEAGARE